ncbi:MAG: MFS transporter [Actinomycetia bacterium]|nr:MFS transporter [Actinomycetes bacterium]
MQADKEILFADELLPGVGSDAMSLKEGLKKGGSSTFVLLLILNSLDELEAGAMALLAPDIRDTFGVSNGTITFITAASAAFIALGAFPMGWLADRYRRAPIIGICTALFTGFVFLTGLAVNAFMMFWTRFGVGIAKANTLPVHSSLIADTYPIAIRGRLGAVTAMCGRSVNAIAPVLIGAIVAISGGDEGWRWAFFILGFPVAFFAFRAFRLPEPPRGQWEKADVLDSVIEDDDPAPISVEAAFARLLRIRTVKAVIIAFCALGFLLFTLGVQTNIYLEEEFGLSTFGRGVVASIAGIIATIFLPFVGRRFDQLYRRDPAQALRLIGFLLLPLAVLLPIQFLMPNEYLFVAVGIPVQVLFASSFAMVGPTVQAIVPYRLRGLGSALVTLYIFLIGAVGGALVAALLIDAYGPRTAIIALAIPSLSIGALMLLRGASSIKYDLSLIVAELQEELEEHERQREDPELIPAIQVADLDFSYGPVQILFDLNFSVSKGETLALLGTNGAGKSTVLRVITGLGTPQRGVVRLHGRTITYSTPEQRAAMGIQMLPGGKGTFPNLSIGDNLRIGAYRYRHDAADVQRRIDRVVEVFPSLSDRMGDRAGNLSGGQQQMLALARVMLHEPEVLIIDELSLGLAPALVQDLLEHIDALKEAGQTMIIVEQSLNVALAVADRAVFLEKGQVRFEGSARELAERDDLARAVFLGSEGG